MAKDIDVEALKAKAEEAKKKAEKDKKKKEEEKALEIEEKAQESARGCIDRIPETLEEAAEKGATQIKVFWYGVTIGGGDFTGTAISERTLELVKEYCRKQGLKTFMRDGEWNAPGVVHEYVLYADLS